ncbi:20760_t:CDS:1, partial [Gigaspora rosea]
TNTITRESQNEESSNDVQENIAPFDVSTVQNPIANKHIKSSLEMKNMQSNTKKEK